jgi:outer membrane protein assembly factor BamB
LLIVVVTALVTLGATDAGAVEREARAPGSLTAFDASTGKRVWRATADSAPSYLTALFAVGGRVFVLESSCGPPSPDAARIVAFDERDGSRRVSVGVTSKRFADNTVVATDAVTGRQRWTTHLPRSSWSTAVAEHVYSTDTCFARLDT